MSCLAEWATVRWGLPPTPVCQVVMTEGWLWHAVSLWWRGWNMINPTIEFVWSHCDTVNFDTVSGDDMGPGVLQNQKKTCACCGIFRTTYVRDYNNIHMFFVEHKINTLGTNIYMLLENRVTYIKCNPNMYICCLKIEGHIIKIQWHEYVM